MNSEAKYFNAFNLIEGIGTASLRQLINSFDSLEEAWQAKNSDLIKAGLTCSLAKKIEKGHRIISPDLEMEKLAKENIDLITIKDKKYPRLLKEIYNPPSLLYIKGSIKSADRFSIGVVGTRKISAYGQKITPVITNQLVKAGLTIVSGLAKGIDTFAHQTALESNGRTIAVLGSGLDKESIYPICNQDLAEEISKKGALISEFPIKSRPLAYHFPQRNRIISGLSLGILVIEAPQKSGAIITANCALEQNRDVFAVPGDILFDNSSGPNNLIKMGAKLVSQAKDILEELNIR